jgi:5'-3' exonuclease
MKMARMRGVVGDIYQLARGLRIGVDLSVWLYQVAARSSDQLRDIARMTSQVVGRATKLVKGGVAIVVVFDCPFTSPAKAEERARRRRAKARSSSSVHDDHGDDGADGDEECPPSPSAAEEVAFVDVHGAFQRNVWNEMHAAGIPCIMSPAEADHQLASMCDNGTLDGVITVDSDLLVLGVPLVFTNVKFLDGTCTRISLARLYEPLDAQGQDWVDPCAWLGMAPPTLRPAALMAYACVAPSDFNHVPHVGPAAAVKLVSGALQAARGQSRDLPALPALDVAGDKQFTCFLSEFSRSVHALHLRKGGTLDQPEVLAGMRRAFICFRRSIVFCLREQQERPLSGPVLLTAEEEAVVGRICPDREQAIELAFGQRDRGEETHRLVENAAEYFRMTSHGVDRPLEITYLMLPHRTHPIFELDPRIVHAAVERGTPALASIWPKEITKAHLLTFFRCVGESGYSDKRLADLQLAACLWLAHHRNAASVASDDEDAAPAAAAPLAESAAPAAAAPLAKSAGADVLQPTADVRVRYTFHSCLLRDPFGMNALQLSLAQGIVVPVSARDSLNDGVLALPPDSSPGWLGEFDKWASTGARTPPTCDAPCISAHYSEMFPRGEVPLGDSDAPLRMCRPMERALQRILRMTLTPDINVHIVRLVGGRALTWIKGHVPASQTKGTRYFCRLCAECVATDSGHNALSGLPTVDAASPESGQVTWSLRRILWVECPCKQKWKCAHGGSLLWMLTLWCTARRENHRDRTRTGLIAYNTWWLGLSQGAVAAHERQMRGLPVHLLDMESIREGAMPAPGSEMGPARRARHDYDPLQAYGDGMAPYALPALSTAAVRLPLYEGLNASLFSHAASGERVGMSAHQFTYARGGEWLLMSQAQRDVVFPPGEEDADLLRTLDAQHRARQASAGLARLKGRARRKSVG